MQELKNAARGKAASMSKLGGRVDGIAFRDLFTGVEACNDWDVGFEETWLFLLENKGNVCCHVCPI